MNNRDLAEKALEKAKEVVGKIVPDKMFNDSLVSIGKSVESLFDAPTDSLTPMLHIFSVPSKGQTVTEVVEKPELIQTVVMMAGFGDNKREMLRFLGAKMAENKEFGSPMALFLITEAWVAMETPKERKENKDKPFIPPSERPDRNEVVMISGCTLDMRFNMMTYMIRRVGKNIMLGEKKVMDYVASSKNTFESPLMQEFFWGWMMAKDGQDPESFRPAGVKGDVNELFKHPIKAD